MESKQASLLYEYWTFFEMADLLRALVGEPLEATTLVRSDELTTQVPENEIRIRYPGDIELAYNRSFAGNLGGSYSVTLRPDITLDVGETRHFFDAKFRVERPPAPAASIDEAEELAVAASLPKGWFKAEDVRKMHTYREAIGGCPGAKAMPVGSVWSLPGHRVRLLRPAPGTPPPLARVSHKTSGCGRYSLGSRRGFRRARVRSRAPPPTVRYSEDDIEELFQAALQDARRALAGLSVAGGREPAGGLVSGWVCRRSLQRRSCPSGSRFRLRDEQRWTCSLVEPRLRSRHWAHTGAPMLSTWHIGRQSRNSATSMVGTHSLVHLLC